jgi:hypothetical protein
MKNPVARVCFWLALFFALTGAAPAQKSDYYKAIQRGAAQPIDSKEFRKAEQDAVKQFGEAAAYERLANLFGKTTEKVWAAIYGEVFCNVTADPEARKRIGALAFEMYRSSVSVDGDKLSVSLTENAQVSGPKPPFESQFEMAFLFGAIPMSNRLSSLTIETLSDIRTNQIALWKQRKLPSHELVKWQNSVIEAGHFEAYHYWLFEGARPEEFREWLAANQAQFDGWLQWHSKNKFNPEKPDFHRLRLM